MISGAGFGFTFAKVERRFAHVPAYSTRPLNPTDKGPAGPHSIRKLSGDLTFNNSQSSLTPYYSIVSCEENALSLLPVSGGLLATRGMVWYASMFLTCRSGISDCCHCHVLFCWPLSISMSILRTPVTRIQICPLQHE